MPLPVAHALLGASIIVAGSQPRIELNRIGLQRTFLGAFLATLPDLDFIATWIFQLDKSWHRGFSHSLIMAIVVGLLVSFWERERSRLRWSILCICAMASHGLLDFLVSVKSGVALLWPLTSHRFASGLLEYPNTLEVRYFPSLDVLMIGNGLKLLSFAAIELVSVGALLGLTFFVKGKLESRAH